MESGRVDDLLDWIGIQHSGRMQRGDEFNFLCPTHADHRASASLNCTKELYSCFVCGGGPIPLLMMKTQQLSWKEANRIFREKFGGGRISWDELRKRHGISDKPPTRRSWFSETQLEALPFDRTLETRGISAAITALYNVRWFERYSALLFPYYDRRCDYVAHIIRWLNKPIRYQKLTGTTPSDHLFGLPQSNWSEQRQRFMGTVHIVEGPVDVLKLAQLGIQNVVGLFGSKLSEAQAQLLRRAPKVISWLDNDEAGRRGAWSVWKHLRNSVPLFIADYGDITFKDPGELTKAEAYSCLDAMKPLTRGLLLKLTAPKRKTIANFV